MRGLFGRGYPLGHAAPLAQVMRWQVWAIVVMALIGWLMADLWAAGSAAFGGGMAGMNTAMLRWRLPTKRVVSDPSFHLRGAYRALVERFFGVALLFWLGLAIVNFLPLWLLTGFIAGQLGWLAVGLEELRVSRQKRETGYVSGSVDLD